MTGYQLTTDPTHYCAIGRERSVSYIYLIPTIQLDVKDGQGGRKGDLTQNMHCGCYGRTEGKWRI
jgi:hypothetical protein